MGLKEQMGHELKSARDVAAKAEAENREMTADEVATASAHLKAYNDFKAQLDASAGSQAVKDALAALGSELGLERNGDRPAPNEFRSSTKFQTLGQMFVESDAYKGLMSQFGTGTIGEKARVQSDPVGFKRLFARRGEKALVTGASDTSGGAFVQTDVQPDVELLGRRPLTIRDLVSVRQTDSDTVEFVQQTTQASSAAPVAEATSAAAPTTGASSGAALTLNPGGGYKPEGTIAYQKVTATVKTIAEWIPATKRGLADASQLRGLIDQELRDDLAEEEEDQILNGNGTGENITGILATSGIQAQAYAATVTDLDPLIETTLMASTKVKTVGRSRPTGYVLNPADWEKIQLARLAKNPNNEAITGAVPTLHGVPVVESEAIAAGVGLVGDFRKAVIWDREQASITATDSHADFFIRNLVAILAEERLAFGVLRPKAFVSIDLTA
jgi:HK97 family phage major capsid protein